MGEGTITNWTEGILLSIAVVLIMALIVGGFNGMYGKNNQIGLGTNSTTNDFVEYQNTADGLIKGGEADFNSNDGITLRSSWGITKQVYNIVGSFITGGWIEQVFNYMSLGEAGQIFAKYLRIIWFISLVFAILYILFKVIT